MYQFHINKNDSFLAYCRNCMICQNPSIENVYFTPCAYNAFPYMRGTPMYTQDISLCNPPFLSFYYTRSSNAHFTIEDALQVAYQLDIRFNKFDVEQFRIGMDVELEHGTVDMLTNVTNDDALMTGKIALAHLNEFPDYYKRLTKMEEEAEEYWEKRNIKKEPL